MFGSPENSLLNQPFAKPHVFRFLSLMFPKLMFCCWTFHVFEREHNHSDYTDGLRGWNKHLAGLLSLTWGRSVCSGTHFIKNWCWKNKDKLFSFGGASPTGQRLGFALENIKFRTFCTCFTSNQGTSGLLTLERARGNIFLRRDARQMCRAHTCGRPLWGEALQAHSGYEMHLDVIDPPLHTHTHTDFTHPASAAG